MIDIARPLTNYIIFERKKIQLNMSFDNVLKMYEVFKDDFLTDYEKVQFALALLCKKKITDAKVLDVIFKEQIETFQKGTGKNNMRVVDFKQDSAYIYSSFFADYGIDLIEMQGRLHWQKFISLFQSLSEKTKIREIMSIRSRPLPEPTKYNQKQIQALIDLKAYYALEISQAEREQNFQAGLKSLAGALMEMAKKGGGNIENG